MISTRLSSYSIDWRDIRNGLLVILGVPSFLLIAVAITAVGHHPFTEKEVLPQLPLLFPYDRVSSMSYPQLFRQDLDYVAVYQLVLKDPAGPVMQTGRGAEVTCRSQSFAGPLCGVTWMAGWKGERIYPQRGESWTFPDDTGDTTGRRT